VKRAEIEPKIATYASGDLLRAFNDKQLAICKHPKDECAICRLKHGVCAVSHPARYLIDANWDFLPLD